MKRLIPFLMIWLAADAGEISMQWQDNSGNEDAFEIQRSNDFGDTWSVAGVVGANVTAFTDIDLEPGSYMYRVRAANSEGFSGFSNIVTGNLAGIPADPSGLTLVSNAKLIITLNADGSITITEANDSD